MPSSSPLEESNAVGELFDIQSPKVEEGGIHNMDMIEGMMTMKSVRRYTDEPVTEEEIWTCLRAAVQAPNGGNAQPWQWLVVTDPDKRQRIGEAYRRAFDRYWPAIMARAQAVQAEPVPESARRVQSSAQHLGKHMGEAPALVMLLGERATGDAGLEDGEGPLDIGNTYYTSIIPALENFMLAARALGIGTCLTTLFRIYQDDIREICEIPDNYEIEALVPMGRPRGRFGVAPRRPVEASTSWDTFANRPGSS